MNEHFQNINNELLSEKKIAVTRKDILKVQIKKMKEKLIQSKIQKNSENSI